MNLVETNSKFDAIDQVEWIRLAAFIDGEGCIRIATVKGGKLRRRRILYAEVSIANTDSRLMLWLKGTFGGSTCVDKKRAKPNWAPRYSWSVASRYAVELLRRAYPYLLLKKEQANEIFAFQTTVKRWGVKGAPDEVILQQWKFKERLQLLKGTASKRNLELSDEDKLLPRVG